MEVKEIPIDQIEPNPWNPNRMSKREFEALKQEIQKRGQIYPIVVRELENGKYQIIDGEHRWKAMKELGYRTIKIINLGKVDDRLAKILTVNLNQIRGEFDIEALYTLIESMISKEEIDPNILKEEMPLLEEDIDIVIQSLNINTRYIELSTKKKDKKKTYKLVLKFTTEKEYERVVNFLSQYGKSPEEAIVNIIDILSTKK